MTTPARTYAIAFPTQWGMAADGLVIDDIGRLRLAQLAAMPVLDPVAHAGDGEPIVPDHVVGLAPGTNRSYFTPSDGSSVLVRHCDGTSGCFLAPGNVTEVGGIAIGPAGSLLVVDRARHRVVAFDQRSAQILWSWAVQGPEDVTVTASGTIFVAGFGGVYRLGLSGAVEVVASTAELDDGSAKSLAAGVLAGTEVLAISTGGDAETTDGRVIVVGDVRPAAVERLERLMRVALGAADHVGVVQRLALAGPVTVRWHGDRLLLAAPRQGVVRAVDSASLTVLGELPTPEKGRGFVAIGFDRGGVLWASNGTAVAPSTGDGTVSAGRATIGPVPLRLDPGRPHQLRAVIDGHLRPTGLTLQTTFPRTAGADTETHAAAVAMTHDRLVEVPAGATEVSLELILTADDGDPSPDDQYVQMVELRLDEPGLIEQLPAIYRSHGSPEQFLDPFLRLAASGTDDIIGQLVDLADQFDPGSATDDLDGDRWLDWLATWVDVAVDERWVTDRRRLTVAGAFVDHGQRGTAASLARQIELELGIAHVDIIEPGDVASVWILGDDSSELGFTTMAAASPAVGSIADTTAVADRSHLIGSDDYGEPLFGDLAHRFIVRAHAAHLGRAEARRQLVGLIERNKPAHTHAHVCVIEPGIAIGLKGTIGVDAVIGPEQNPLAVAGLQGFTDDLPARPYELGHQHSGPMVLT